MTQLHFILVVLLSVSIAFVECNNSTQYYYTFGSNGTCTPYVFGTCLYCDDYRINRYKYYQYTLSEDGTPVGTRYTDAQCTRNPSANPSFERGYCSPYVYGSCTLFQSVQSFESLSLSITSESQISLFYNGDADGYAQISQFSASCIAQQLEPFVIKSSDETFVYLGQINENQYNCSLGTFDYDQTYSSGTFTFSVNQLEVVKPTDFDSYYVMRFFPQPEIAITSDDKYSIYFHGTDLNLFTNEQRDMEGVTLISKYLYTNIQYFPPYQYQQGYLYYQTNVTADSTYRTRYCYQYDEMVGEVSYEVASCSIPYESSNSFDLNNQIEGQPDQNSDQMSFSLF